MYCGTWRDVLVLSNEITVQFVDDALMGGGVYEMVKAGKILRHYRTKVLGWSQKELGAAIGLSNQYISKLERQDYIPELTRERLAPVLGCNPGDLRPGSDDLRPSEESPPHGSINALRAAQLIGDMSEDVLSRVLPILESVVDAFGGQRGNESRWDWEIDPDYRFTSVKCDDPTQNFLERRWIGQTRWELGGSDVRNDEKWKQHKIDLDARRDIAGLKYELENDQFCHVIEGKPVFADNGDFVGYKGVTMVRCIANIWRATNEGKVLDSKAVGSDQSRKRRRKTTAS